MEPRIGVFAWARGDVRAQLKRAALFCDQIALKHVHGGKDCAAYPDTLRDIQWLAERGVIVGAPDVPYDTKKFPWLTAYRENLLTDPYIGVRVHLLRQLEVPGQIPMQGPLEPTEIFKDRHFTEAAELYTRVLSAMLTEAGKPVTPLLGGEFTGTVLSQATPTDAVVVALEKLPLPDAATPVEAIMDWRNDEDAKRRLTRLRVWLNRALRQHLTTAELRDELEVSLADYGEYMALHHRKMARGRCEIVCSAIAEVLEALPKIKLSPLLDVVFHSSRTQFQLAEIEAKAPGRELAYILRARERFEKQ